MESSHTKGTKMQKSEDTIRIPKILDTKVEPLFSLPSDLMSPKRCKRKKEELISIKGKLQKFYESSYTAKRLQKENFRRYMVGLIEKPELPAMDIDLSDDRDINRYYYYICNGVDTIHTAHIEQVFIDAILDLVSSNLRDQFPDLTNKVMAEIKEDFTKNIKKAIIKFALTDPAEEYPSEFDAIEEDEQRVPPDFWRHIEHCREILRNDLYLINPCMRITLDYWFRDYSKFRLINFEYIYAHKESWDLLNFHTLISHQIVANRRILEKDWYSEIQEIFLVNNRKNLVPSLLRRKQFKRFFDCAGKLMESHLLNACKLSLRDFINYVIDGKPVACCFKVNFAIIANELVFEPLFDKFKELLCDILDLICNAVRNFERLETQLYLDWTGPQEFLKPQISEYIVEQFKKQINHLIDCEKVFPEQKIVELEKYAYLFNNEEFNRVEAFLQDETKKLKDYKIKIKNYHDLAGEIPIKIQKTIFAGFFEVSSAPFIKTLVENIEHLKGLLIQHLVDKYQDTTKR
ncbi:hypothetical protein ACFW04_009995 [Cataglyphis niger]